jgi:phage/plasmid-associated DNA primase
MKLVLRHTLDSLDPGIPYDFLLRLLDNIRYSSKGLMGVPNPDKSKFVFTNALWGKETLTLKPWTRPDYFVTTRLGCAYNPEAKCPETLKFLFSLAEGHEDRVHLLRCWFSALVRGMVDTQVVLMIVGPGGTGKSTFSLLATALVGKEFTVTTSLRSLHSDPFEVANLEGKSLIYKRCQ